MSRLTKRPQSRQIQANYLKLVSLCEQLVRNLHGDEEEEEYRASVDYATRSLSVEGTTLNKVGVAIDQSAADKTMRGWATVLVQKDSLLTLLIAMPLRRVYTRATSLPKP
jgi:hypothetical protein